MSPNTYRIHQTENERTERGFPRCNTFLSRIDGIAFQGVEIDTDKIFYISFDNITMISLSPISIRDFSMKNYLVFS